MKKKLLSLVLTFIVLAPCFMLFVACGENGPKENPKSIEIERIWQSANGDVVFLLNGETDWEDGIEVSYDNQNWFKPGIKGSNMGYFFIKYNTMQTQTKPAGWIDINDNSLESFIDQNGKINFKVRLKGNDEYKPSKALSVDFALKTPTELGFSQETFGEFDTSFTGVSENSNIQYRFVLNDGKLYLCSVSYQEEDGGYSYVNSILSEGYEFYCLASSEVSNFDESWRVDIYQNLLGWTGFSAQGHDKAALSAVLEPIEENDNRIVKKARLLIRKKATAQNLYSQIFAAEVYWDPEV